MVNTHTHTAGPRGISAVGVAIRGRSNLSRDDLFRLLMENFRIPERSSGIRERAQPAPEGPPPEAARSAASGSGSGGRRQPAQPELRKPSGRVKLGCGAARSLEISGPATGCSVRCLISAKRRKPRRNARRNAGVCRNASVGSTVSQTERLGQLGRRAVATE